MKHVFGFIGTNLQDIDLTGNNTPPDGWILMETERPSDLHVAEAGGLWVRDFSAEAELRKTEMVSFFWSSTANWRLDAQMGDISSADTTQLKAWIAWRKAVEAVDTSAASEETPVDFPPHP